MTQATPAVMDQVAAALPTDYESARVIWHRVVCWSYVTVRNILSELVRASRAESADETFQGSRRRLFRRPKRGAAV